MKDADAIEFEADRREAAPRGRGRIVALTLGLALALAVAVGLWGSQGSEIFIQNAFAALAACL